MQDTDESDAGQLLDWDLELRRAVRIYNVLDWRKHTWGVPETEIPSSGRQIVSYLAARGNTDGSRIWPSTTTIASDTALSRRTVEKHLRDLESKGWLIRRAKGKSGKGWRLNQYFPAVPACRRASAVAWDDSPEGWEAISQRRRSDVGGWETDTGRWEMAAQKPRVVGKWLPTTSPSVTSPETSPRTAGARPREEQPNSSKSGGGGGGTAADEVCATDGCRNARKATGTERRFCRECHRRRANVKAAP